MTLACKCDGNAALIKKLVGVTKVTLYKLVFYTLYAIQKYMMTLFSVLY